MSEFGKGQAYCLGLVLCHAEHNYYDRPTDSTSWFCGANDHLIEFSSAGLPPAIAKRADEFVDKVCGFYGSVKSTKEDVKWAVQEAKDLLRLIDDAHGVGTEKGEWE